MQTVDNRLDEFRLTNKITTKGHLSIVLQLTRLSKSMQLPLEASSFLASSKGQLKGVGGGFLANILAEHGITRRLASEGGRTTRGSIALKDAYIELINGIYNDFGSVDFDRLERYWVAEVRNYFAASPFVLVSDKSCSITQCIGDLFTQVRIREQETPGTHYLGAVLQHLVAAKLRVILPDSDFTVRGFSVADEPSSGNADFILNEFAIHCTTAPSDQLLEKCRKNLDEGKHPVIITISTRVTSAKNFAEDNNILDRLEVWGIEQFLSSNIWELSGFSEANKVATIEQIIVNYNAIIDEVETDPSLKIRFMTDSSR